MKWIWNADLTDEAKEELKEYHNKTPFEDGKCGYLFFCFKGRVDIEVVDDNIIVSKWEK